MRGWIGVGLMAVLAAWGCGDDGSAPSDAGADGRVLDDPVHDELSRPEEPTLDPADFNRAEDCGECHRSHYAEWKTSMHAYAMIDPVYRALVKVRQVEFDGEQDQFCTQCHSAIGTRGGDITPGFAFEELSDITLEGVTCEGCHRVAELRRLHNSGHVLDPAGPIRGPIADPEATPAHDSVHSPLMETSELCAGCHDVVELDGLDLERPYEEWALSPAATDGRTCQSCHMPTYRGSAVAGGPERELHRHTFVGVDVPLTEDFVTEEEWAGIRADVVELLDGTLELRLDAPDRVFAGEQIDLVVTVKNLVDGHNLPTGSTFIRQMWLEVVATAEDGTVLYETGGLDSNGDLRDHYSEIDPYGDSDLVSYSSRLVAIDGSPELFPWRAAEMLSNTIPPLHEKTNTLFVPTADGTAGPVSIAARVRFRTHPPYLLRALDLERYLDRVQTYDLVSASTAVEVVPR